MKDIPGFRPSPPPLEIKKKPADKSTPWASPLPGNFLDPAWSDVRHVQYEGGGQGGEYLVLKA